MNKYLLIIIIVMAVYILSVIIKAIIFYKEMFLIPITDYKNILEFQSITLGIIYNIVVPLFIFKYLKEVHDRNKQRKKLASQAIMDYLQAQPAEKE